MRRRFTIIVEHDCDEETCTLQAALHSRPVWEVVQVIGEGDKGGPHGMELVLLVAPGYRPPIEVIEGGLEAMQAWLDENTQEPWRG